MIARDVHRPDLIGDDLAVELAERDGRAALALHRTLENIEQRDQQERDDDPEREITEIVHVHLSWGAPCRG